MTTTVAVLAAQGRSGRATVAALLEAGFEVRAGVRREGTLSSHPRLTEVPCDALQAEDVAALIKEADAVVSMIGHNRKSDANVQTTAIRHCISALAATNPTTPLISLTGTGVRRPGDSYGLIDRLANAAITLVDPARMKDGENHVQALESSELPYTVLRVLKLTGGAARTDFTLTPGGPALTFTSRATVAAAVVRVISSGDYQRQLPVISSAR